MFTALMSIAGVICWLLVGFAGVIYKVYHNPRAFMWDYEKKREASDVFFACVSGPIIWLLIGAERILAATDVAREKKLKLIEELEKELAAARKEIDDFLKQGKKA